MVGNGVGQSQRHVMFTVGDKVTVTDTGETGIVTEGFGRDCYMVLLEGWPEPCQIHGR